jgi:ubiquinone/menaquinone biosynthesis C-methylase UbiE
MGLYEKWVLPRLLDLAMRNDILDYYRRRTIASACGQVLEIGVGSGPNLSLYGPAVGGVVGLDPSPELLDLAGKRAARALVPVSLVRASAQSIPFTDAAFDAIVMTWTLCSIANPLAALMEMRRVLKPGGQLLFVEHGAVAGNPDRSLAAPVDSMLETDRRRVSSRPQNGRPDPGCRVRPRSDRNRLHERPEALDLHVSGFGDEVGIMAG